MHGREQAAEERHEVGEEELSVVLGENRKTAIDEELARAKEAFPEEAIEVTQHILSYLKEL